MTCEPRRRTVLTTGAAALLAALATPAEAFAGPTSTPASVPQRPGKPGRTVFTFVTDTHADVDNPINMERLSATLRSMVDDKPKAVVHGGDITEYGSDAEYSAHLEQIPHQLRDRMHYVPGNHDSRWDVTAYEGFTDHMGRTHEAFTAGGVQFIMVDSTVPQHEFAFYSDDDLAFVRKQLAKKPRHRPTVLVTHHPMAEGQYFAFNYEDLFSLIEGRGVVAILAGHTHRQHFEHVNGLVHLEGAGNRDQSQYYRFRAETDKGPGRRDTWVVEHVAIPDHTDPKTTVVKQIGTVDLDDDGRDLRPKNVRVRLEGDKVNVRVQLGKPRQGTVVRASIYNHGIYAGRIDEPWVELPVSGPKAEGALDVSKILPGEHRVIVEVVRDGRRWREIRAFTKHASAAEPVGHIDLGGMITGGTVVAGRRVLVPTSKQGVVALDPAKGAQRTVWRANIGPVLTNLALDSEKVLAVAGSTDGYVYGLLVEDGSVVWRRRAGAPVMSNPVVTTIDGDECVIVMAGTTLLRMDVLTGRIIWRAELPAPSAGTAAADDEHIYLGLGDGKAHAVSAKDGSPVWSRDLSDRKDAYRKFIYGPWTAPVTLLDDDLVLVPTVSAARALHRATGEVAWELKGSVMYSTPRHLPGGDLLLVTETGETHRVEATTGAVKWTSERIVARALDAGPVIDGDRALVVSTMAQLAELDLATGKHRQVRQLSRARVVSTPAVVGTTLTVGHLDGSVRTYRTP